MLIGHHVVDSSQSALDASHSTGSKSGTQTLWRWYPFSTPPVVVSEVVQDHSHFHLMDVCWPVATTGEWSIPAAFSMSIPILILITIPSTRLKSIVVWDIKTGVVIKNLVVDIWGLRRIVFSGNYTITLVTDYYEIFRTYDLLEGTLLCDGKILLQPDGWLGAHWEHENALRFATSSKINEKLAINIHQFQPSPTPLPQIVESFLVPPHYGNFSFSPVSFHASFVTDTEIAILHVRDSKILLRIEETRPLYRLPGGFSPDGRFFSCGTLEDKIRVWKNTPAGYVPWNNLEPRLPFDMLSFSPTAFSILTWGPGGIQLLDNRRRFPSPAVSHRKYENHLVAYSEDGTRVATARRGDSVVTVLDLQSGVPPQSINTEKRILDIGIVNDAIFIADTWELVSWHLEAGEVVRSACGGIAAETATMGAGPGAVEHFTLSSDCSWIGFTFGRTVFLYDVQAQRILNKCTMDRDIVDIRFSPYGRQLYFILEDDPGSYGRKGSARSCMPSETVDGWRIVNVTEGFTEDVWSRDGLFPPHGYRIRRESGWIEDSRGSKLLWLPPNWRMTCCLDTRWNGDFLALVDGRHPEPIVIKFQPQPLNLPPHSSPTHSSDG